MENIELKLIQQYCLELVNLSKRYIQNSNEIEFIYIYISIEWNEFFNAYFKGENLVLRKNKVNELTNIEIDVSIDAQSNFNDAGNIILRKLKSVLKEEKLNNPTQIKIIYNNKFESLEMDVYFNKYLSENIMISAPDFAEKWFAQLGGKLSPNSMYRMKQLFGDDFLEKK